MKKKEFNELKSKKQTELLKIIQTKKLEQTNVLGNMYAGKLKNLKKARNLRKEIAQILTLINKKV